MNAQHIKQVPGRKTDVADCAWIAQLLQHGLLTASFIPPTRQRELRDRTRHRSQLGAEQTAAANRVQKVLEDANIKLGSVASDVLGVSGRAMLDAIIAGQDDPAVLADLARRRMRGKIPQLREALRGRVTEHHRFLLQVLLEHIDQLDRLVAQLDARIAQLTAPDVKALNLLTTIPGIQKHTAEVLLAEIGPTVDPFPTAGRCASWAGMCPGNNESAGKRRTGRTRRGNRWLRQALVQAGWAASHSKKTYLGARYRRVARRRRAGPAGDRAYPTGDRVSGAPPSGGIPGTRSRLLRPAPTRTVGPQPGAPSGATRAQVTLEPRPTPEPAALPE